MLVSIPNTSAADAALAERVIAEHDGYESEGSQKAAKLRQSAADCNAVILARFEIPSAATP